MTVYIRGQGASATEQTVSRSYSSRNGDEACYGEPLHARHAETLIKRQVWCEEMQNVHRHAGVAWQRV